MRKTEDRLFERFRRRRDPADLGAVFDRTAPELLQVAVHLCGGDGDRAQDALQATFLTALQDAGRWDPDRPLRPWLLGILANHVHKERRAAARARGLGDAALAEVARGDPLADAASGELRSALADALRALPQPYRQVLTLHLQHGLNGVEIAEVLDRPPGTVRAQVARGLELLRRMLPAGFAAAATFAFTPGPVLAAVRSELFERVPLSPGPAAAPVASLSAAMKALIMSALSIVLAVCVWLALPGADLPEPPTADLDPANASVQRTPIGADLAETSHERREIVAQPPQEPATSDGFAVRVTVRDSEGAPVPGQVVFLEGPGEPRHATTGAGGGAVFDGLLGEIPYELHAAGTFASALVFHFGDGPPPESVELTLPPGFEVLVEVRDRDGRAVPGARVEGSIGFTGKRRVTPLGSTDDAGNLRLRHLAPRGQLRAWARGLRPSGLHTVEGEVGDSLVARLTCPGAGLTVSGRVLDPMDRPLPAVPLAVVQCTGHVPDAPQFLESGPDGRFTLDFLSPGHHILVARHATPDGWLCGMVRFDHRGDALPDLELRLLPGARVNGSLLDAAGQPRAWGNVAARHLPEAVYELPFTNAFARTDDAGRFLLAGLLPGRYALEAGGSDEGLVERTVELHSGQSFTWEPVQPDQVVFRVRLLDAGGAPLAGWRVSKVGPEGFTRGSNLITGEDGRAQHAETAWRVPAGSRHGLELRAPLPEGAGGEDSHELFPSQIVPPLLADGGEHEIRVPDTHRPTARIIGRVVRADGREPGRGRVTVTTARASGYEARAWINPTTGAFEVGPFSPGSYRVSCSLDDEPRLPLEPVRLQPGETLDLGTLQSGPLTRVRVLLTDGELPMGEVDGLRVLLLSPRDGARHRLRRDGNGWRSAPLQPGDYLLTAYGGGYRLASKPVHFDGSERRIELDLERGAGLPIVVALPTDQLRNQSGWAGTCTVRDGRGAVLLVQPLDHAFRGHYRDRLPFSLPLPEGRYDLEVRAWDGRKGRLTVEVPAGTPPEIPLR